MECTGEEGSGRAWVRVLVPEVVGLITAVRVHREGDCGGIDIRWRKRSGHALITVSVTAESECWVETVRVLSTG